MLNELCISLKASHLLSNKQNKNLLFYSMLFWLPSKFCAHALTQHSRPCEILRLSSVLIFLTPNPHISYVKLPPDILALPWGCPVLSYLFLFLSWMPSASLWKSKALFRALPLLTHVPQILFRLPPLLNCPIFKVLYFVYTIISFSENSIWCTFKEIRKDCLPTTVISPSGSDCLKFYN